MISTEGEACSWNGNSCSTWEMEGVAVCHWQRESVLCYISTNGASLILTTGFDSVHAMIPAATLLAKVARASHHKSLSDCCLGRNAHGRFTLRVEHYWYDIPTCQQLTNLNGQRFA